MATDREETVAAHAECPEAMKEAKAKDDAYAVARWQIAELRVEAQKVRSACGKDSALAFAMDALADGGEERLNFGRLVDEERLDWADREARAQRDAEKLRARLNGATNMLQFVLRNGLVSVPGVNLERDMLRYDWKLPDGWVRAPESTIIGPGCRLVWDGTVWDVPEAMHDVLHGDFLAVNPFCSLMCYIIMPTKGGQ